MLYSLIDLLGGFASKVMQPKFDDLKKSLRITQIIFESNCNREDIDLYGFYKESNNLAIFICHDLLKRDSPDDYPVLYDIVCVHEYAHMIHDHMNTRKFRAREAEIGFIEGRHYVEAWAQWCTYQWCKRMGDAYISVFLKLCQGQSEVYREYERLNVIDEKENNIIIDYFLNEDGWFKHICTFTKSGFLTVEALKQNLQKKIDADPSGAMGVLRPHLANDCLKDMKLVWPENTRDYVQVLTDLGEFGF